MKVQLVLVICFLAVVARCEHVQKDVEVASVGTTTESDALISSLEKIVNKVKSMKERVEKTLNDTASDVLEKSHHDFLIARGYSFTPAVGYHKLYLSESTWSQALHRCRKEKAHLAVIDSPAEGKALADLMKSRMAMLPAIKSLKAYVGIHDYCKNGAWITIFFDILDKASPIQWKDESSDDATHTKAAGPNCAVIDDEEYVSGVKCSSMQPFICEIHSP